MNSNLKVYYGINDNLIPFDICFGNLKGKLGKDIQIKQGMALHGNKTRSV